MKARLFFFVAPVFLLAVSIACQKTYSVPPLSAPVAIATPTPSFNCAFTPAPVVACQDPYGTPTFTPGPCLSSTVPNGQSRVEICNFSNNGLTKVLFVSSSATFGAGWTGQVSVSPTTQITSLGAALYFSYQSYLVASWDGTDQSGNPVPNGCYAFHMRYADNSGNFQQVFIPVIVNRPVGRVMVDVFDGGNQDVRALYRFVTNPGTATSISSMSLSAASFQPSYCNAGPSNSVTINFSNGAYLVWDGRNNQGTILPAGTYTVKLCVSDDTNATNLSSTVSTVPLAENSAASTVVAFPTSVSAGSAVTVQAGSCGSSPLTLNLSVYDSGNNLVATIPGAAGTNEAIIITTGWAPGTYQVKTAIYDSGGYTGTVTVYFTLT